MACKGWRWMPGMLARPIKYPMLGLRVLILDDPYIWLSTVGAEAGPPRMIADVNATPDLADPATLGCLLALVRKAWGDPGIYAAPQADAPPRLVPGVCLPDDSVISGGVTEAEALVLALEAAP